MSKLSFNQTPPCDHHHLSCCLPGLLTHHFLHQSGDLPRHCSPLHLSLCMLQSSIYVNVMNSLYLRTSRHRSVGQVPFLKREIFCHPGKVLEIHLAFLASVACNKNIEAPFYICYDSYLFLHTDHTCSQILLGEQCMDLSRDSSSGQDHRSC